MTDLGSRIQRAIDELTGNEALLGMLDEAAAAEMLDWGIKISTAIVNETDGLEDVIADASLLPRLKAVRNSMRSIGNWAVGRYAEADDRAQLRDKLIENFKTLRCADAPPPSPQALDDLLNQVDDKSNTPHQLVVKMIQLLAIQRQGDS